MPSTDADTYMQTGFSMLEKALRERQKEIDALRKQLRKYEQQKEYVVIGYQSIASIADVSTRTIRRHIKSGKLPVQRFQGSKPVIPISTIEHIYK